MSTVKITTTIEISGSMVEETGVYSHPSPPARPRSLTYVHTESATGGDNPRFYGNAIRDALIEAHHAIAADVTRAWRPADDVNKV